ncbi:TPA: transcriptional regulator, partial [Streptococcus pyogenes]|nr:transcriptional regulator [Streptococcus pyogenes]
QTPVSTDINVGGGKANLVAKETEDIVVKWSKDGKIKSYENFRESVDRVKALLDKELTEIFELRWGVGSNNTWEEIAYKIHTSRAGTYRKRDRILTLFAQEIGKL